jgi:N-dimethylarginine dimethylaminohydrolase
MVQPLNEFGRLKTVLVKHARDAFVSQQVVDAQWRSLNFTAAPDFSRALAEYDAFLELIAASGAEIRQLPRNDRLNLDSIYTRDASIVCAGGAVICSMGKPQRRAEPAGQEQHLGTIAWPVAGRITSPGLLEGGDLIWLDSSTVVVGQGMRTNAEGVRQLKTLLNESPGVVEVLAVPLPDHPDPHDVMHLMSLVSPVDADLAVVYSRLLPASFRNELLNRGYRLVDVSDDEYETMGTNVLALAPRACLMVKGNPQTRAALERAGATVYEYDGAEISHKGGGGPTCLTRPLARSA